MVSFREFYEASNSAQGNYVSVDVLEHNLPELKYACEMTKGGTLVPDDKKHVTLMYSKETSIDCAGLELILKMALPMTFTGVVTEYACFDDLPKDGERDSGKAALVAKLESPIARVAHDLTKAFGCVHSYPEFSPHVTLCYGADREEAREVCSILNLTKTQRKVTLGNVKCAGIVKNWADTINEATYKGNIGMMEMARFFAVANDEEKKDLRNAIALGDIARAWSLVERKLKVKLHKSILGKP